MRKSIIIYCTAKYHILLWWERSKCDHKPGLWRTKNRPLFLVYTSLMWNRTVLWLCHRGSCHIIVLLFITCKTCNSILVFVTVGGAVILHTVKAQHIQLTVNVLCVSMYLPFVICYVWTFTVSSSPPKTRCTGEAQGTFNAMKENRWI